MSKRSLQEIREQMPFSAAQPSTKSLCSMTLTTPDIASTYRSLLQVGMDLTRFCNGGQRGPSLRRLGDVQLHGLRVNSVRSQKHHVAAEASYELLQRTMGEASDNPSIKQHRRVLDGLYWLIRSAARGPRLPTGRQMAYQLFESLPPAPDTVRRFIEGERRIDPATLKDMTRLNVSEWRSLLSEVRAVSTWIQTPAVDRITFERADPLSLDVGARLARIASKESSSSTIATLPNYDSSESTCRISALTISGFRGSPSTLTLDLTSGAKPVNVLLWGDNGVGKSTIVDGVEFALQGRVDRSSDFTSSLRPKVRNLSVKEATARVALSDGSTVERSLITNAAGRDAPSDISVRPGFRIAPLVIRRADILRFLDTDALTRGTIFFDYFPDASGGLGVRPGEELKMLDEERSVLLVVRADLLSQLQTLYPDEKRNLVGGQELNDFVADLLAVSSVLPHEDPSDEIPEATRRLIRELRETQSRLQAIKKKLEKGVESLNPVAYRAQLARVVPALQSIGSELTSSFKHITRAEHVAGLDVLVAKSGPVSLDVVVRFDNGTTALPQQVFSEGYKDLVALLFFLALTKKAGDLGQARVLVLDDALQSVDSSVRVGIMDYILEEFKDWQLIVTGHDRGWLAQLRALFARRSRPVVERIISRWSFSGGAQVSGSTRLRVATVRAGLDQHDERMTAAAIGILLEEICQELSWRLEISLHRRQGDRYSLGDLWPGVAKAVRVIGLRDTVDRINQRSEIRNLLGGHFNDYADSIAWSDVRLLAEDVLALHQAVYCDSCGEWIARRGGAVTCRCGSLPVMVPQPT